MKRLVFAALAVAAFTLTGSAFASGGGAGNTLGQQCKNGGYLSLVGTSGPFATQAACVSYAVNHGTTYAKTISGMSVAVVGPVNGLGALVGNPQSRTAGGFNDPAMQFNITGTSNGWVPNKAISLSYTAAAPLSYTYANPTSYFPTAGAVGSSDPTGSWTAATFFQDNCFDNNNVLVSGSVPYTLTASNSVGQSATKTGMLDCSAIGATVLATANSPSSAGYVDLTATGWHFTPNAPITLTYSVDGTLDGANQVINNFMPVPNADANGHFAFDSSPYGDNCIYDTGSGDALQTGTFTFTMTATDGTHASTATGTLDCSKLGA